MSQARKIAPARRAQLKALALEGDTMALAVIELAQDVTLVPGVLGAGAIPVTGQVVDGVGNVVHGVQNLRATALGTSSPVITPLGVGPIGTFKLGSGSGDVWMVTDSLGRFNFQVEDSTPGELMLLEVRTEDGLSAQAALQF